MRVAIDTLLLHHHVISIIQSRSFMSQVHTDSRNGYIL